MMGKFRLEFEEIEAVQSNNNIASVKEFGYVMAEKLGCFDKEQKRADEKLRDLYQRMKMAGCSDSDIAALSPKIKEAMTC